MKEFAITLETETKTPLYEQIYEAIRDAILTGRIPQGEKLPSTRFEADYLQVSRSTVELAYGQLLSEGYIQSEPYRGYFACDVRDLYHLTDVMKNDVAPKKQAGKRKAGYDVDFSPNGIELKQFPFGPMSRIMKNLLLDEGEKVLQSSLPFGDENFRQVICDYLYRSRNVCCMPEQIVVGAGNEYLQILLYQLLGGEHRVAMESPTYLRAYRTFRSLGSRVEEVELDQDGMRVDVLAETEADIAYVMPSHQFPLGIVMPMKRRLELLNWASQKPGRYIIEDDYDSEFRYKGKPIPALQGMDRSGCVIYLGTFSKSIAPSVRVSYMVLPMHLLERYEERCGFYACTVPNVMQQTIYQFMKEGYFEKNLNRMRGIYKAKHDFLLNELKNCSWVKKIMGENSGLHLLVEVKSSLSEAEIIERCKKAGIRIYGISEYFISKKPTFERPGFLIGYGELTEEQMIHGIRKIGEILESDGNFSIIR